MRPLSLIADAAPIAAKQEIALYEFPTTGALTIDSIVHFAAGVIWKTSVWPGDEQITLGPYRELLRRFLLREVELPQSIAIAIFVARMDSRLKNVMWPPTTARWGQTSIREHHFVIPGIRFSMFVGQNLPAGITDYAWPWRTWAIR